MTKKSESLKIEIAELKRIMYLSQLVQKNLKTSEMIDKICDEAINNNSKEGMKNETKVPRR